MSLESNLSKDLWQWFQDSFFYLFNEIVYLKKLTQKSVLFILNKRNYFKIYHDVISYLFHIIASIFML